MRRGGNSFGFCFPLEWQHLELMPQSSGGIASGFSSCDLFPFTFCLFLALMFSHSFFFSTFLSLLQSKENSFNS